MTSIASMPKPAAPLRFILKTLFITFRTFVDSYGLSVSFFSIIRLIIGEQWVLIAFFNTFAHLLWLPALGLLPLFALLRQWRSVALLTLPVVMYVLTYGGQFIPRTAAAPENATQFTLATYNLFASGEAPNARIAVIRDLNADVVALQEITVDFAAAVENELADLYPYRALHPVATQGTAGQGILSRYPILEDEFWRYDWLYIALGHQRVVLDMEGVSVVLYNLHPAHPGMANPKLFFDPTQRNREIGELLALAERETGAVLLAGDFNMPDLSEDYGHITQHLGDAYRAVGWGMGWTFHNALPFPFMRLDYVFYSDAFQPLSAFVGENADSDHAPLLVTLALEG